MRKATLGTATSTLQLSRSIGTAIGVTLMGAILSFHMGRRLERGSAAAVTSLPAEVRAPLSAAQHELFGTALVAALASLAFTAFAPRGRLTRRVEERVAGGWTEASTVPGT